MVSSTPIRTLVDLVRERAENTETEWLEPRLPGSFVLHRGIVVWTLDLDHEPSGQPPPPRPRRYSTNEAGRDLS